MKAIKCDICGEYDAVGYDMNILARRSNPGTRCTVLKEVKIEDVCAQCGWRIISLIFKMADETKEERDVAFFGEEED